VSLLVNTAEGDTSSCSQCLASILNTSSYDEDSVHALQRQALPAPRHASLIFVLLKDRASG
jgi:hypothetical protein